MAYGSNMWPRRIEERLGRCETVGMAALPGFDLRFHKRGRDGSGKCDAFRTGDPTDTLYGVVYSLNQSQRDMLDAFEGPGYSSLEISVRIRAEFVTAYAYVAKDGHVDSALPPFSWYKSIVVAGARAHALPAHYIESLDAVYAQSDPDSDREARHLALLERLGPLGEE